MFIVESLKNMGNYKENIETTHSPAPRHHTAISTDPHPCPMPAHKTSKIFFRYSDVFIKQDFPPYL